MKKKIFIALLIIVIIAVSVTLILKKKKTSKFDYQIEKMTEYNYYIYKENEKYGVINKDGDTIIEANYSNIIIPNPQKDLFICYNEERTEIVTSKKEKIFTQYESIQPIKLKNVAGPLTYEKSVLIYKKDNQYGLIDFSGNIITETLYDTIENLQPTEGKFLVSKDEKYGVIDLKGNTLVNTEYDKILSDEYYTEEGGYTKSGFIVSYKQEDGYKYGYIDYTGKSLFETKYNEIKRIQDENNKKNIYLIIAENGKYGLYKDTKQLLEHDYQSIVYNDENTLTIQRNKKYGIITLEGKQILKVEYDKIETRGLYIYTEKANDKKVYDKEAKEVDINYNASVYETTNSQYRIITLLNNNITYYGIADKNNKILVEQKYRYIEYLYKDYFIASDENGKLGVINSNEKSILAMEYSSLQKVKDKNILQAIKSDINTSEFYSIEMKKITTMSNINIQTQEDYIIISNEDQQMYLNSDGDTIKDPSKLKATIFPDKIKDYQKKQITVENIYYTK